jgi:serine/threonine protein kinase
MSELQNDELLAQVTEVAGYKVLPPCVVYARIGQGGMGAVYRGRHLNLDIEVAVKCLKPALVRDDPQFVARFRREGQSAARINHQNVIRVFDVAEDNGLHYLIMEYVQGETARQRVDRKGPLAVGEALQILYESARGLGEAHRLGIVHRDIKPDNLLISTQGQVKVADLGLAKPTLGKDGGSKVSMLSSANQIMGTPSYMPPEQWDGAAVTAAADVWALGATLWFLLVGREAIRDESPARIMSRIVLQPFPDVLAERPDVPADVAALLAKATAKEPGARFLDAGELADAIEELDTRRASLRDRAAGTTQLRTMLSPPPLENIDELRKWWREDARTRPQTPSRLGEAGGSGLNDGQTIVTPPRGGTAVQGRGGTVVQTPPDGTKPARGRSPIVLAAVLLVAGAGGGYAWWSSRPAPDDPGKNGQATVDPKPPNGGSGTEVGNGGKPAQDKPGPTDPPNEAPKPPAPPPAPFALADERLGKGDLDGALVEVERIATEAPATPELPARLARLLAQRAERSSAAGRFEEARADLRRAQQQADSPALQQQRVALRTAMRDAAAAALLRERPAADAPQPGDAEIEFAGRLSADYVQDLLLGGEPVGRVADGRFTARRRVDGKGELAVAVRVDDETLALPPWRVTLAPPPPGLSFVGEITLAKPRPDGKLVTGEARIVLTGKLSEPGATLYVDDVEQRAEFRADGSFSLSLELTKDGERELRFTAKKSDRTTPPTTVRVVRLMDPTTLNPITPPRRNNNESTKKRVPFVVRATNDYATDVVVRILDQTFPLVRDAADPRRFAGEVVLATGPNKLKVTVTNLAGKKGTEDFDIDCKARGPSLTLQQLEVGATKIPIGSDANAPIYVASAAAVLRLLCDDPAAELLVGDEKVTPTQPFGLALQPYLREGEPCTLQLRTRNENDDSPVRQLRVVLDSTQPKLTATAPDPVPAGGTVALRGTWQDRSDPRIEAEGRLAQVQRTSADGGTWTLVLPAPTASTNWRVVATDAAGNGGTCDVAIVVEAAREPVPPVVTPPVAKPDPPKVDPVPPVATKDLKGFRAKGDERTSSGYPLAIVHDATGIELVAIDVDRNGKPAFYAAVREVSERQWEGTGSDAAKSSVTAEGIVAWLGDRGRGLDLPNEADWSRLVAAGNPAVKNLRDDEGKDEWLRGSGTASNWPIRKDPSTSSLRRNRSSASIGFRVVHRPN